MAGSEENTTKHLEMQDCHFENNSGTDYGAALYVEEMNSVRILNCGFEENLITADDGGAILLLNIAGDVDLDHCWFYHNHAEDAGAICMCCSFSFSLFFSSCCCSCFRMLFNLI